MICMYCNKECKNERSLIQHQIFCKENENRIIRVSGFKNKKHTNEVKEFCKKAAIEQWSNGLGVNPPSFKDKKHSEITKEKISNALIGNSNGNHRGDRQSFFNNIRMDSSWEVQVAIFLTKNNICFIYGEKVFKFNNTSYKPDFYLPYENKYIEVKGYWREKNLQKFNLFKELYPDVIIEVWDKKKLKELKII